jgi:cleavage and polyadenylation specificity factor subunit 3
MPFFDDLVPSDVDLILITHFHIDHIASLPYFTEVASTMVRDPKSGQEKAVKFNGPIYMTPPTKALMSIQLQDFLRHSSSDDGDDALYSNENLKSCLAKIKTIKYRQHLEYNGIKFWCYPAGHVLGACMFVIEIAGKRILYTGDYTLKKDRHLLPAEIPSFSPDLLIMESTMGDRDHESVEEREKLFIRSVEQIVLTSHGRCLLPATALGSTQEIMLLLDDHWKDPLNPTQAKRKFAKIPMYYVSSMAQKAVNIYKQYINDMNKNIQQLAKLSNPFDFHHISKIKSIDDFEDNGGPCVVFASPAQLNNGESRRLFDRWCSDPSNGVISTGLAVEGSLLKRLIHEDVKTVQTLSGEEKPRKCKIESISFAAHADQSESIELVRELKPPNIILVHGNKHEQAKLRAKLMTVFDDRVVKKLFSIDNPANEVTVKLLFKEDKLLKVLGGLAELAPTKGAHISGLLVSKDFSNMLISPEDVPRFTELRTSSVRQRLKLYSQQPFSIVVDCISAMYENVRYIHGEKNPSVDVEGVRVIHIEHTSNLIFEWSSSPVTDMIADSLTAIILQSSSSPAAMKRVQHGK